MRLSQRELVHDLLCDTEASALCDSLGDGFCAEAGDRIHGAARDLLAGEVIFSSAHGFEQLLEHHGFELLRRVLELRAPRGVCVRKACVEAVQRDHHSTSISASSAPADFMAWRM